MTHTISGTLGSSGSGASVFFSFGIDVAQVGPAAIADAGGNFTSGPLPDNTTYNVTPVLFGAEFSPAVRAIALATADVTGVNWFGVSSYYALSAPDNVDSFNRGGVTQNPVVGWDTLVGDTSLQVVSDQCTPTAINTGGGASSGLPTGYVPQSPDQYCQYELAASIDIGELGTLGVRKDINRTVGIHLEWGGILDSTLDNGGAVQIADLTTNSVVFSSPGFADANTPFVVFHTGDILLFIARGDNFYVFLKQGSNTIPMGGGISSSTPNAGRPGIELSASTSVSAIAVKNWAAGSVVTIIPSLGNCGQAAFGSSGMKGFGNLIG